MDIHDQDSSLASASDAVSCSRESTRSVQTWRPLGLPIENWCHKFEALIKKWVVEHFAASATIGFFISALFFLLSSYAPSIAFALSISTLLLASVFLFLALRNHKKIDDKLSGYIPNQGALKFLERFGNLPTAVLGPLILLVFFTCSAIVFQVLFPSKASLTVRSVAPSYQVTVPTTNQNHAVASERRTRTAPRLSGASESAVSKQRTSDRLTASEREELQQQVNSLSDDDAVRLFVAAYQRFKGKEKQEAYDEVVKRAERGDPFYRSVLSRISRP